MLSFTSLSVLASVAVSQVAAHGGVLSYSWTNTWYWGWEPYDRQVVSEHSSAGNLFDAIDSPTGQTTIQRPWSS